MDNKKEIRTLPLTELRIGSGGDGGPVIEGHAAVFNSWSELLGSIFPFKERVRPGAFVNSIATDDIRALFNHDPNYVLGRNRAGTLALEEDEIGLKVKINPPETQWAKDMQTSIKRGDITQMSIGFIVLKDDWKTEGGVDVRELIEVQLFDVSPVTFPAYTQTEVGVRAMNEYAEYRAERKSRQEAAEREDRELREAAEKAERERIAAEEAQRKAVEEAERQKRLRQIKLQNMKTKFKNL